MKIASILRRSGQRVSIRKVMCLNAAPALLFHTTNFNLPYRHLLNRTTALTTQTTVSLTQSVSSRPIQRIPSNIASDSTQTTVNLLSHRDASARVREQSGLPQPGRHYNANERPTEYKYTRGTRQLPTSSPAHIYTPFQGVAP